MEQYAYRRIVGGRSDFAIIGVMILFALPSAGIAQGFGAFKKDADLYRKRPPAILLRGTNISVRVNSSDSGYQSGRAFEPLVRDLIERVVHSNGGGLVRKDSALNIRTQKLVVNHMNPDVIINCSVPNFRNVATWKKKTEYERTKVGEKEEWDAKQKKMVKKDVYKTLPVEYRYQEIVASVSIELDVLEAKTRSRTGGKTFSTQYRQEFKEGKGAPQESQLFTTLLKGLEYDLARALFVTDERVEVLLPKGKFESASEMIESGNLDAARRALDVLPPMKDPQDEAYRTYSLGAMNEVQAYKTADIGAAIKHLQQAIPIYQKAAEVKPDEKYFSRARVRAEESLQMYTTLEIQMGTHESARGDGKQARSPSPAGTPPPFFVSNEPKSSAPAGNVSRDPRAVSQSLNPEPTGTLPTTPAPAKEKQPDSPPTEKKAEKKTDAGSTSEKANAPAASTNVLTNEVVIRLVKAGLSEENIIATIQESRSNRFDLSPEGLVKLLEANVTNRVISAMRNAKKSK